MPPKENLFSQLPDSSAEVSAPPFADLEEGSLIRQWPKILWSGDSGVECGNLVVDTVSKVVQT